MISYRRRLNGPAEALRLLLVFTGSLGALGPLLGKGLPGGTLDGTAHLYRLLDFDQAFRQGLLLPRLAPNLALGYGYASFTYYSPLTLYLDEGFRLFGLGTIASLKACFVAAILAGGFGMYLFARDLFGWRAGLVAALAYVYTPYLLLDVYSRGDLAESFALGILPFVFWSLWRTASVGNSDISVQIPGGRGAVLGVCLAALVMLHNLTALLIAPVLLVFLVVTRDQWAGSLRRVIPSLVTGGVLGLCLSAVYWLPVVTTLSDLNLTALTDGFFDYHRSFIPLTDLIQPRWVYDYGFALEKGACFNLGRVQTAILLLATLWAVAIRPRRFRVLIFASLAAAALLWLQQPGAAFMWDLTPGSRFVQFPYRLAVGIAPLGALLVGSFFAEGTPVRAKHIGTLLGLTALVLLIVTSVISLPRSHLVLQEGEVNVETLAQLESSRGQVAGSTRGDYMPKWVAGEFFQTLQTSEASPSPGETNARLTARSIGPLSLTATITSESPTTITVDRLYLPNWNAQIDGTIVPIGPSGPLGVLTIPVPAGQHLLTLETAETPAGEVGILLSSLGILIVFAIFIGFTRPKWQLRLGLIVTLAAASGIFVGAQIHPSQPLDGQGIDYPSGVRLVGSALDLSPTAPPGVVQVSLLWEVLRAPLPDCTVHLRLVDATGQVVARRDKTPHFGIRPCSAWSVGQVVHDVEQIRLSPGVAPGPYRLVLGISVGSTAWSAPDGTATQLVSWHDPGQPVSEGSGILLGEVFAPAPPPSASLPNGRPIGAVIGNLFALDSARVAVAMPPPSESIPPSRRLGLYLRQIDTLHPPSQLVFRISNDPRFVARVAPGGVLGIDLLWRSLGDASVNYAVFTHLLNSRRRLIAQDDDWPDRANLPTVVWFPGDTVVDHYRIAVPPNLAPGVYTLATGMYERGKSGQLSARGNHAAGDQVILGTVKVSSANQRYGEAVTPPKISATFGNQIALTAGGLGEESVRPGGTITVDLVWQAIAPPSADYTVFVHVLNDRGKVVAQHDSPPLGGAYPTRSWDPGDRVGERIAIPIPSGLPTGTYRIEVGLYLPANGIRLATPNGSTIILGTLQIT